MWYLKKFMLVTGLALAATLIIFQITGCSKTSDPVYFISVSKARPMVFPSFGEGIWTRPSEPHPDFIQEVLSPGDKIYLGLVINKENKQDITFSRYTFFNTITEWEIEVGERSDLGPFEPGQITEVAFYNPWIVPEKPAIYEVRIYMDSDIVASALFEVR